MNDVGKAEIEAISKVVESTQYFRYQGPGVQTQTSIAEKEWAEALKASFCLLNTSGTNALVVGMAAFGIGPGDEVIIPSYTFVATAAAVMQVGAIPIIANVDETLTLDLEDVKRRITPETKAIVAVHIDGLICDLEGLAAICCERELFLVEDAAQALGASYRGTPIGTYGAFGGFSFNRDKVISCGEGGLLVIGPKGFEKQAKRAFITHDTPCQYGFTMKDELSSEAGFFGLSTRMNEINASMLRSQLARLPDIVEVLRKRKKILMDYLEVRGFQTRRGHDCAGDNGSVVHLKGVDPLYILAATKALIGQGIKAMSPTMRPAHASWQWVQGMSEADYYVKGLNPYVLSKKKYSYPKADFVQSIQILGSTLRIPVPGPSKCTDSEFLEYCEKIGLILKNI
jgi:8-amino-3,8-dideoxy-alpha-D-manno-octulosonate transaminase